MSVEVSDQERHRRVEEEGSRRKRDLAGHRRFEAKLDEERREQLLAEVAPEHLAAVPGLWAATKARVKASVPDSTYRLWIEPLEAAGADEKTLYLSAPEGIRAWAERRYAGLIAEALADSGTALSRVSFAASPIELAEAA